MIMTKEQFADLRYEMENALAAIAEKYNCDVSIGNIKYDDINTDIVVSLRSKGADGKSADFVDDQYCYAKHKGGIIYPEHDKAYLDECVALLKEKEAPIDWDAVEKGGITNG